jgi:hypothetical protein
MILYRLVYKSITLEQLINSDEINMEIALCKI